MIILHTVNHAAKTNNETNHHYNKPKNRTTENIQSAKQPTNQYTHRQTKIFIVISQENRKLALLCVGHYQCD